MVLSYICISMYIVVEFDVVYVLYTYMIYMMNVKLHGIWLYSWKNFIFFLMRTRVMVYWGHVLRVSHLVVSKQGLDSLGTWNMLHSSHIMHKSEMIYSDMRCISLDGQAPSTSYRPGRVVWFVHRQVLMNALHELK